jgi:hypothetical protein
MALRKASSGIIQGPRKRTVIVRRSRIADPPSNVTVLLPHPKAARKSPTPAQPRSGPTRRPAPGAGKLGTDPSTVLSCTIHAIIREIERQPPVAARERHPFRLYVGRAARLTRHPH